MFTLESETGKLLKIKAPNFRGEPRFTTKTASTAWKKEGLLFRHGRRELWDISYIPDVKQVPVLLQQKKVNANKQTNKQNITVPLETESGH